MFYIGCLTRTLFFLDACMDALAFLLLFFSLIKLFIIIFFYSFLCLYRQHRQKHSKTNRHFPEDSSIGRNSSSFNSSSIENLPKKLLLSSARTNEDENDNEYVEKRRILYNEYDSSSPNQRTRNRSNPSPVFYEQNVSRKLSSISEKTEKTETDDSEPDLSRFIYSKPKRQPYTTTIVENQYPPVLPIIKNRRKIIREDDNDSGTVFSIKQPLNSFSQFRC